MKKLIVFTVLLVAGLQSCMREDVQTNQNRVQIAVNLQHDVDQATSAKVTSILIRINDSNGDTTIDTKVDAVLKNEELQDIEFKLPSGSYTIQDILVLDEHENVLFAAPRAGSEMALKTSHSNTFGVSGNRQLLIATVSTVNRAPEAFGYKSFKKDKGIFKLTISNSNNKFISANAYILQAGDTIGSYHVKAKVNAIQFTGDKSMPFTLVIVKDGSGKFSADYTYQDLLKNCNKPLNIILEKALSFRFHTLPSVDRYRLPIVFPVGTTGNLSVDWGDGTIESYTFQSNEITHVYQTEGDYFLSLTGDVGKITEVFSYNYDFEVTYYSINLEHLKSLEFTEFGWISSPPILDLSHSKKLYAVDLEDLANLRTLLLPVHHDIRYFVIEERTGLTGAAISNIVANIHANAVAKNIQNGYIDFRSYSTPEIVGPPSAEAIEKLKYMRDSLHWNVLPNL